MTNSYITWHLQILILSQYLPYLINLRLIIRTATGNKTRSKHVQCLPLCLKEMVTEGCVWHSMVKVLPEQEQQTHPYQGLHSTTEAICSNTKHMVGGGFLPLNTTSFFTSRTHFLPFRQQHDRGSSFLCQRTLGLWLSWHSPTWISWYFEIYSSIVLSYLKRFLFH